MALAGEVVEYSHYSPADTALFSFSLMVAPLHYRYPKIVAASDFSLSNLHLSKRMQSETKSV